MRGPKKERGGKRILRAYMVSCLLLLTMQCKKNTHQKSPKTVIGFLCSNVDGFNLPLSITPEGNLKPEPPYLCVATSCATDINLICPPELQVKNAAGKVVACNSACAAFNQPQYCCSGPNGTPDTCPPTSYSKIFKQACPTAYSYAYDDPTSMFYCDSKYQADYRITFCPAG